MSARRIARELAVIIFPQLPKDKEKLGRIEIDRLLGKAVAMLSDYARQNLSDAAGLLARAADQVTAVQVEHPVNAELIEELLPAPLTTAQIKEQLELVERSLHLVQEALDIPELVYQAAHSTEKVSCGKCGHVNEHHIEKAEPAEVKQFLARLIETYSEHRDQIDDYIRALRAKWKIERMVSIDRDILRLACTEAFFMDDIPINVSISEAVELCHRFADDKAARFINGVLADMAPLAVETRRTGVLAKKESSESGSTGEPVQALD